MTSVSRGPPAELIFLCYFLKFIYKLFFFIRLFHCDLVLKKKLYTRRHIKAKRGTISAPADRISRKRLQTTAILCRVALSMVDGLQRWMKETCWMSCCALLEKSEQKTTIRRENMKEMERKKKTKDIKIAQDGRNRATTRHTKLNLF